MQMVTTSQHIVLMITGMERAINRKRPVTLTYVDYLGRETVRTVEPYELEWTQDGHLLLRALDRSRILPRSFRMDRVRAYTIHYKGERLLDHEE